MEKCFFGEGAIKQRGSITGGLLFAWRCRKGGSQKMILYFSATGNGKYIAEQIAEKTDEKCMSIVDCICEDKYCFSNEKILWCRLISGVFHGLLQNIWESSELKIVDIHFSLPAMEQRQVRLAVWRRRLWLIMGRTLMPTIV